VTPSGQIDRAPAPVTVVVARVVTRGRENDFRAWAEELTAAAERYPGFLGWGLLRPAADETEWHVVYRFDSAEHLDAWEHSPVRAELLHHGTVFMQTVAARRLDGLDAWFAPAPQPAAPPRWKTFLMTAVVILALQTLVSTLLRPLDTDWPTLARTSATIVPVVALMTWVVMPRLSRLLRRWLYPAPR
jgi:antibiotic biosynthesis monooxygenase (ABM) superfamily enzyme